MPATLSAPRRAHRPLRAFHVSLRTAGQRLAFTALARSSGEALGHALARPELAPPVAACVRPVGAPAEAMRLYLADLVEG